MGLAVHRSRQTPEVQRSGSKYNYKYVHLDALRPYAKPPFCGVATARDGLHECVAKRARAPRDGGQRALGNRVYPLRRRTLSGALSLAWLSSILLIQCDALLFHVNQRVAVCLGVIQWMRTITGHRFVRLDSSCSSTAGVTGEWGCLTALDSASSSTAAPALVTSFTPFASSEWLVSPRPQKSHRMDQGTPIPFPLSPGERGRK